MSNHNYLKANPTISSCHLDLQNSTPLLNFDPKCHDNRKIFKSRAPEEASRSNDSHSTFAIARVGVVAKLVFYETSQLEAEAEFLKII